jgi:hypothetical protein
MNNTDQITKARAKKILRDGVRDMSVERLIQMAQFGLAGTIDLTTQTLHGNYIFNHILYDGENDEITFMASEEESFFFGQISFPIDSIAEISGCENAEDPRNLLDIRIRLKDDTAILLQIIY